MTNTVSKSTEQQKHTKVCVSHTVSRTTVLLSTVQYSTVQVQYSVVVLTVQYKYTCSVPQSGTPYEHTDGNVLYHDHHHSYSLYSYFAYISNFIAQVAQVTLFLDRLRAHGGGGGGYDAATIPTVI